MTPHKHAEVIKAWADGATIQVFSSDILDNEWIDCPNPGWSFSCFYRVKKAAKMKWFRVSLLENGTLTVNSSNLELTVSDRPDFIRWLTDRIEYEVTP